MEQQWKNRAASAETALEMLDDLADDPTHRGAQHVGRPIPGVVQRGEDALSVGCRSEE